LCAASSVYSFSVKPCLPSTSVIAAFVMDWLQALVIVWYTRLEQDTQIEKSQGNVRSARGQMK
jgi:hypothetical protein